MNLVGTPQAKPVALTVGADDKSNSTENVTLTSGASEQVPSPDGEQVAFVVRGDVFVAPATGGKATRVTDAPQRESDLTWSPDGKTLIFVRDGDLYSITSADSDEPKLSKSLKRTTTRLTETAALESNIHFSPDGKKLLYIRGKGELLVSDADGKSATVVTKVLNLQEINWSPDSKWVTYSAEDAEFNNEIFVQALGGGQPINVSRHPRNDYAPSFSPDGTKLVWMSERADRQFDIYWVYLKKDDDERSTDAWQRLKDKKKPAGPPAIPPTPPAPVVVGVDADGIHERVRRLTATPTNEVGPVVTSSPDGATLVAFSAGPEIQLASIGDGTPPAPPRRLASGGSGLAWAKGTLFFLTPDGGIAAASPAGPPGEARPIAFRAKLTYDKHALQKAVFEEAWEVLNQSFYDPNFHGANWAALREKYRPWAAAASDPMDFYDVIRFLMGHLNSSHIGIQPGIISDGGATPIPTGFLGVIWDESYTDKGLKVARVLKGSPADRSESRLTPGEIVTMIGSTVIDTDTSPDELLADTVGEKLPLTVTGTDGKSRDVLIVPAATTTLGKLLYDEWTSSRQELAHKLSDGKLAYLHIQSMDKASQDKFEAGLFAEAHGREALLIDVRDNGGGSTADYLLTMLSQPQHAFTIGRDGAPGYPTDRLPYYPWRKPAGLLINENSYSNAEIFSHAFKQLDRGPIIGVPTFGAVISTGGQTLLDGSQIRTPGRGWYRISDGVNEEHTASEPDIRVEISPTDELAGRDSQLEVAVKALLSKAKPVKLPEPKPARLSTASPRR